MTRKNARRALVTLVAAMSMVFAMVGSAFAQYPPAGFVTCDTTAAGATATCVIDGLGDRDAVQVTVTLVRDADGDVDVSAAAPSLASTVLAQDGGEVLFADVVPVVDGEATVVFDIPADAQEGDSLVFTLSDVFGVAVLPVTAAGDGPVTRTPIAAGEQLPRTGLEVGVLIAIAAAAVVVGGGALAASRRKGDATA